MKTIIIGDIHLDKNELTIVEKINLLTSIFQSDCDRFILLGDVFDSRKAANTYAVKLIQNLFLSTNNEIYIIIGNHCCVYKNTLYPNSLETSFKNIPNVHIIDKPTDLDDFLLVPWINDENYDDCIDAIKKSDKKYLCGHLEINSFYMTNGIQCRTGFKLSDLSKFKKVISGHFHLFQESKNICYLGNIMQESWNDYDNQKHYCIVEDDKIEYNPIGKQIYHKIILDDDQTDFCVDNYVDCVVKLFHYKKPSKKQFDKIEELKGVVKSYQIFDESVNIQEVKIEKVEFKDILTEFMKDQEFEYKQEIEEYMTVKYKEE